MSTYAGIYFCLNDRGLPTGEAFIEMETPQVTKFYLANYGPYTVSLNLF